MLNIIDRLKSKRVRDSTSKNYLTVWRQFNKFIIRLDRKPEKWEDRASLFCAYMIDNGSKSSTIGSYVSAIKGVLRDDGYLWDDSRILLESLIRACKLENDVVKCRLPIHGHLLEALLFELQRYYDSQLYLMIMFKAIFSLAYYGLMRIGELTSGPHVVKAKDIHVGKNKDKILIILHSSKTHGKESLPQKIKISSIADGKADCGRKR